MFDLRAKLITPTEAAGFTGTARDSFTDERPVTSTMFFDELTKGSIFFRAPGTFDAVGRKGRGRIEGHEEQNWLSRKQESKI